MTKTRKNDIENIIIQNNNNLQSNSNTIYISPNGGGSGSSISSPTNWWNAYNNINTNGNIIFRLCQKFS